MKAHNAEEIQWRESQDVYQPIQRPLPDFLASIELASNHSMPSAQEDSSLLVFIEQNCLADMQHHAGQDILREQAGILCGQTFVDSGQLYVAITSALPVETINDSASFSFHETSWERIWGQLEDSSNIVGWYHTHPGMGIFLSATDLRTQRLHFPAPWQVAVVMDPVSAELGVFYGADGKQVCKNRYFIYSTKRQCKNP